MELGKHLGKPIFVKLHRDIVVIYFEGRLVLRNWIKGHLLTIDDVSTPFRVHNFRASTLTRRYYRSYSTIYRSLRTI